MPVKVKICGLTRTVDIERSIEYGADLLGFIFGYKTSPRNLEFERLKELVSLVPPNVSTVVVSPASNPELAKAAKEINPTLFQLHGEPSYGLQKTIGFKRIVQTVRPSEQEANMVEKCLKLTSNCTGILYDASSHYNPNQLDQISQGEKKDNYWSSLWAITRKVRDGISPFPLILAGGLNDGNVEAAIKIVKPYAVDVSTGVESRSGVKDDVKLKRFIHNAKSALD